MKVAALQGSHTLSETLTLNKFVCGINLKTHVASFWSEAQLREHDDSRTSQDFHIDTRAALQ